MNKLLCFLFGHKYKYERDINNKPMQPHCKRCGHEMTNDEFTMELIESIYIIKRYKKEKEGIE